jgi:putative SOS response-associated peptidase YedK
MCGRYSLVAPNPAEVRTYFGLEQTVEVPCRYNVAPGDEVLALTTDREGVPRAEMLRWGLVPSWAERPDTGLKMINARLETAAQRPAYRRAYERFHCLVIADGFYEWQRSQAGRKCAFHITRPDGEPFAFAGLWSVWRGEPNQMLRTCTILTRPANAAIAPLHDRMPVILRPGTERSWLDVSTPQDEVADILTGLPAELTAVRPVGSAVNDARYDGPECLAPPPPAAQAALF